MMQKIRQVLLLFLFALSTISAQLSFVARVDSLEMNIGDQQNLTLTYHAPEGQSPTFHIENIDTASFFEIVKQTPWLRTSANGISAIEKKILFSIFDPGQFIIPTVYAVDNDDTLFTNNIPITIHSIEPDSTGLLPIKGIVREKNNWTDYKWYYLAIAALLIGYLAYRYIKHRQSKTDQEVIVPVEIIKLPHEIALEKLGALKGTRLWEKGEVKEFHSQLTYIVREYLENRYHLPALESTSHEILNALKSELTDKDAIQSINDILNIADWVKFAKGIPEEHANAMAIDKAIELILLTKMDAEFISSQSSPN